MTVSGARLDLSGLATLDLEALRLGAQVMRHKAELAARPTVESYFLRLQFTLDAELSRRRREPDHRPLVSLAALPLAAHDGSGASEPGGDHAAAGAALLEDRRLATEYLDLLGANDRLSPAVRQAVRTLQDHLAPDD